MSDSQQKTYIARTASKFSLIFKIFLMVVYRIVLLCGMFVVGHLAYGIHWALALFVGALSFAAIVKFWSPSNVLDGSEINFGKD